MRMSRVLLTGGAVAAVAVTTSAFTAGNTFDPGVDQAIVGYGEATVSGANITAIHYNRDGSDQSLMASVVWETDTDLSALAANDATMTLKTTGGTVFVANYGCTIANGTPTTITCLVGDRTFEDFDTAGLAVGGE
jgi:hypothetical protein